MLRVRRTAESSSLAVYRVQRGVRAFVNGAICRFIADRGRLGGSAGGRGAEIINSEGLAG